ncbi:MAG: DUF4258 domain-containing protein [Candidatus Magnetobacterium sp. LHC-1]
MLDLIWIKECVRKNDFYFSKHADMERQSDNLTVREIEEALTAGRILERYGDTGRGESCLVVGVTETGKYIHIVCGQRGDVLVIITVYIPIPPKFKTPYERGK